KRIAATREVMPQLGRAQARVDADEEDARPRANDVAQPLHSKLCDVFSARRAACRAIARSMSRLTSSRGPIPLASQSLGYIEIAVKPGMVLISFTRKTLSAVRKKQSTRAIPAHSSA